MTAFALRNNYQEPDRHFTIDKQQKMVIMNYVVSDIDLGMQRS